MKTFLILASMVFTLGSVLAADKETRFFELRTYHAAAGKLDALNARFRDHTTKLFEKHGMVNVGYWIPVNNTNNLLIYLLAYPSREAREQSWQNFSADPDWQAARAASEANGKLVDKADSVFLSPTDFSPFVTVSKPGEPRLFELRTYHATPGKLDELLARFRDHTVGLFNKNGLNQFGYFTPTEKKDGAGETLIYLLDYKDDTAAKAAWKAFGADPDWQAALKASQVNGSLTTKIESVYMMPTDYSPTK